VWPPGAVLGAGQQVGQKVPCRWLHPLGDPGARGLWRRLRAVVSGGGPLASEALLRPGGAAREAARPLGSGGRRRRRRWRSAGGRLRREVHPVGGLGPGQRAVGGQRGAPLAAQLGAAALAAHLPYPVLPVGGAGLAGPLMLLLELQVVVGVPLGELAQPAQRLGPFPRRGTPAAQGVGAGDGQPRHLGDHVGDVVSVADETPAHYGLDVEENFG